jgi:hypothetical protein
MAATPEFERPDAESTSPPAASEFEQMFEGIVEKTLTGETLDRQTAMVFAKLQAAARSHPADATLSPEVVRELVLVVIDEFLSKYPAARSSTLVQNSVDRIVESLMSTPHTSRRLQRFWGQLQKSVR